MKEIAMTNDCPIHYSMGILGRLWTLPIMRDIVMEDKHRYHEFKTNNPGLSDRMLTRRLNELVADGFLEKKVDAEITYAASKRGLALMPVLVAISEFGMQEYADMVFSDAKPRTIETYVRDVSSGKLLPRMTN